MSPAASTVPPEFLELGNLGKGLEGRGTLRWGTEPRATARQGGQRVSVRWGRDEDAGSGAGGQRWWAGR